VASAPILRLVVTGRKKRCVAQSDKPARVGCFQGTGEKKKKRLTTKGRNEKGKKRSEPKAENANRYGEGVGQTSQEKVGEKA